MCDKAVNTDPSTIQFVPECYKTQGMCNKAFNNVFLCLFNPDRYKTQEMCDSFISGGSFTIRYVPDQYNTQQLCVEAVDDCLAALKCVPNWFATSKMLENLYNALYVNDNLLFYNDNFNRVKFIGFIRHFLLQPFFIQHFG